MYAGLTFSGGRHAAVLYGINAVGGYIYLMAPQVCLVVHIVM